MADNVTQLPVSRTRTVDDALSVAMKANLPHCIVIAEPEEGEAMTMIFSEMGTAEAVYLLEKAKLCLLRGERTGDLLAED